MLDFLSPDLHSEATLLDQATALIERSDVAYGSVASGLAIVIKARIAAVG